MQTPHQLRIDLENSKPILCDECENDTFVEVNYLRRISKILTVSPQDMIMNVPAFACAKCGHVNDQFKIKFDEENPKADKPTSPIISLP